MIDTDCIVMIVKKIPPVMANIIVISHPPNNSNGNP